MSTPDEVDLHFVMTCEGVVPGTAVSRVSEWNGPPWMTGEVITANVARPFVFRLVPEYPGKMKPMYEGTVLLMNDDLVQALESAGVDNLQKFPAVITDEVKGQRYTNYTAVNIVGTIRCADMAASERMDPDDDEDLINVDFDSLVIDEKKAGGALLFRLAESVSAIVVHRRVKEAVERTVPGMTFYGPGEWSG
jgi:hypothetical protein